MAASAAIKSMKNQAASGIVDSDDDDCVPACG